MNKSDFDSYIETHLGGNLIDVELTTVDYDRAFQRAKRTFVQKGNNNLEKKFETLTTVVDQTEYTLDSSIDTVVRIVKPTGGLYTDDPFSIATFNDIFHNFHGDSSSLLNYELGLQLIERIERYTAYESDFIYTKRDAKLTLLKPPQQSEVWFVECYADLTDEQYRDRLWIQEWTLAECKEILGHAYSKFDQVTTPSGQTSLNGSDLLQEAKTSKEELLEEIAQFTDGDPTGMFIMLG